MKDFTPIYNAAHSAGMAAATQVKVVPMLVGSPSTPFGNDVDPNQKTYFVPGGPCGFAWINIKPGNCAFANWLKSHTLGADGKIKPVDKQLAANDSWSKYKQLGHTDSYYKGVTISVPYFGQSMQLKETYAYAFAKVLNSHGINAQVMSRMD